MKEPDANHNILYECIYIKSSSKSNMQRQETDQWLPRQMDRREFFCDDENVLKLDLDCNDGCTTLQIYQKTIHLYTLTVSEFYDMQIMFQYSLQKE